MIKKIKSSYILKKIISHLYYPSRLDIFKYNKSLQNKIDLNLESYKKRSGRYIIYDDTKNKAKEYSLLNDNLVYEGEYINGKRNGIGREYFYGKLDYEGEYLNGKRNGKGKEFYGVDNLVKFEGEYLNNKRNGKGKEYSWEGYLRFEGDYKDDFRNGKGKKYSSLGILRFEGEYSHDMRNGKGKEYDYFGKLEYEGEYSHDLRNGKGKKYKNNELICEVEYIHGREKS